MWLKGVNSESQAYVLEFCSHIYIESLPYNEGLTVYNTNSLQVYKLRVLYIDNIFRLKCEKYLHRAFIGFPQHTEENIELFFFQLQGQTLHEGHAQYNTPRMCVCERRALDCHTRTQMKALKLAHWEVTVCIVGQNRPLHSDHTFAGYLSEAIHSISVPHPWKHLQTSDSNNSNTFDAVVSGENC